jgi:hypothetical protein
LNLRQDIEKAIKDFSKDVESGKYPDSDHSYFWLFFLIYVNNIDSKPLILFYLLPIL